MGDGKRGKGRGREGRVLGMGREGRRGNGRGREGTGRECCGVIYTWC